MNKRREREAARSARDMIAEHGGGGHASEARTEAASAPALARAARAARPAGVVALVVTVSSDAGAAAAT